MIENTRLVILVSGLLISVSVFAGSVYTLETTSYITDPATVGTTTISVQQGSSRTESKGEDSNDSGGMIFHSGSNELVVLDHGKKGYYVLDEASMQRVAARVSDAMQQMQKALEDMPPEQRAMAEKMMKEHLPSSMEQAEETPATVQKTGKGDSINGFDCEYYEIRRGEQKLSELCVTEWDEIAGGREVADAMLGMAGIFESITKTMSGASGLNLMGERKDIFAHMNELNGYPVLAREFDDDGTVQYESVLKSATTEDIDPEYFNPPPGYTKMELEM